MAGLGGKNDQVVMLKLASGSTVADTAQETGVSERTISRRLADAEFRRRVTELRADMIQRALGKMADAMAEDARTLRALISADKESVRLGAAGTLWDPSLKQAGLPARSDAGRVASRLGSDGAET